ncbi:hypothetical protein [Haloarchaeobius litoreus]|uniref:Uncharacterized protein n=1 Tax=Haloarchaeobius litoreus TaxID=755306 RepID=A0ABD6DGX8_9EURY|nr:hypothetical protein [Haloarchaeobius litoreus]
MSSLIKSAANRIAGISIEYLFGLASVLAILFEAAAILTPLPKYSFVAGVGVAAVFAIASYSLKSRVVASISLQDPQDASVVAKNHINVTGEISRLIGHAEMAEWTNDCRIKFRSEAGFDVKVGNNPAGTERSENMDSIFVHDGVNDFDFTLSVIRATDAASTYDMKIVDTINNHHITEYTVEIYAT